MPAFFRYITLLPAALLLLPAPARPATFGTVVPIRGQISDIAVDNYRGLIYAANFPANRVEVISQQSGALQNPIPVNYPPSTLALSPDGTYLVIGQYVDITPASSSAVSSLTIVNLVSSQTQSLSLGNASVLTIEFGNSPKALMVLSNGVSLLDPVKGIIEPLTTSGSTTVPLPVPWATYSPNIIKASAAVSGDGNVIYSLIDGPPQSIVVRYQIDNGGLFFEYLTSSPTLGPRVVSVNQDGSIVLDAWSLDTYFPGGLFQLAQFPYPGGALSQGSHVWDPARNFIYGQIPTSSTQPSSTTSTATAPAPLLQIFDSDNLTVRETLQLGENLAGKSLLNGDIMYAISESGLTILPIGQINQAHRVASAQEDVYIQAGGCSQSPVTQSFSIVDPGGGTTDFTLTVSAPGVTVSPLSGTTPATVQVTVDPTQFQSNKGTAVIPMQLSSTLAVNLPKSIRLLVNTSDPNQQGAVYDVPGTIVDVLADPTADRFFVLRQDMNEVLVFDGTTFQQTGTLRTGNTPVQMAIADGELVVTADNSQSLSVYDLATLTQQQPVFLPPGQYPRSIAASNSWLLATSRSAAGTPEVLTVNLANQTATVAPTGIFAKIIDPASALATSPSGNSIFMTMPTGTVALFDDSAGTFLASRQDLSALSGAYAALSDSLYMVGNNIFDAGMVPISQINLQGGVSSGVVMTGGLGLLTSTPSSARNGLIERFSTSSLNSIAPTVMPESPSTAASMASVAPVGQVGQTILPFTRTLAPLANGTTYIQLSTSGFSAMPTTFDVPQSTPVISSITNAADGSSMVAPGGLVTLWGSSLTAANAAANTVPLPKGLGGVCLYMGSTPLPLFFVSPTQINTQLPFNLPPSPSLVLRSVTGQSAPFSVPAQPAAPAIFRTPAGGPMIIRTVDGKYITNSTPIHENDSLIIYMTGLGQTSNQPSVGAPSPSNPLAITNLTPAITIGGKSIWTTFSGLAPGLVGVNQVNALVPFTGIPTGSNIPFTIDVNGVTTTVKLSVDGP